MGLFNFVLIFILGFALHCPAMCGPVVSLLYPEKRQAYQFHVGRFLGYTTLGLIAGKMGALIYSLGFAALGIFGLAAVVFVLFGNQKINFGPGASLKKLAPRPLLLGLMFTFIPCHYLWTMLGIAALSGSIWLGGSVMAAHAIMSAVGIQLFQSIPIYQKLRSRFQNSDRWLFALSMIVLLVRVASQSQLGTNTHLTPTQLMMCW